MAAYVVQTNNYVEEFHVGNNGVITDLKTRTDLLQSLQLDGDELEHVLNTCPIPLKVNVGQRVVVLAGDFARTAMLNW